ncbi:baseplate J/gp47 family protein [Paenibacillus sp. HWE-109]|uniref:baseplate J/gp47 family protein n=1 Tax=Paenibacillus sp. HWE-109 TaxID=1306526 RepID=UPI001EDCE8E2|nr:baseplate J/gp47 family protein [Paenibacillus sp. HWE-109]UKS30146.1 baseplate J/gp47 family protein [Paenibacillus sp. HWE-109]
MYETQTKAAVLQRMLGASDQTLDLREGSATFDLLSPAAIEMARAYMELDNVLKFGFADTTYGPYLDMETSTRGIYRKLAVKAAGSVRFGGTDGTVIAAGTVLSTGGNSPILFVTKAAGTIASGSVTVAAEAQVGGISGNVAAGAIALVFGNLSGVASVTNSASFAGGVNEETDAELLARFLEDVRKPATSGNANQYRKWALEVSGISDAKVYPIWAGAGTVKVVLLDGNKRAPTTGKVTEATTYIASQQPIGATATVVGATEVAINVVGTYTLKSGSTLAEARAQIAAALTAYLASLAFVDSTVRYTQIANIVLGVDAVIDYSSLTVNGGTSNITVADGSVAIAGTVT